MNQKSNGYPTGREPSSLASLLEGFSDPSFPCTLLCCNKTHLQLHITVRTHLYICYLLILATSAILVKVSKQSLTKYCHHHPCHICQCDWVFKKEEGDCNDSNPLGDIGHSIGQGGHKLEQSEGKQVLKPVETAISCQQQEHLSVQLTWNLECIHLKKNKSVAIHFLG